MKLLLLVLLLGLASLGARADDGGVSFGGAPRLMSGHPSISMQNEVVRMQIGSETVHVDCRFVFHNAGPACVVRMGFPDNGQGASDPEQEGPQKPLRGAFTSYSSFVDGLPVTTKTLRGKGQGQYWHVKTVTFAAGQTRRVHDVYSLPVGGQVASHGQGAFNETYYILHTAASWHGPIGQGDVFITFAPGATRPPLALIPLKSLGNDANNVDWSRLGPGMVVYRGPGKPSIQGSALHFHFQNLRPAYLDDILLYFHYLKIKPAN